MKTKLILFIVSIYFGLSMSAYPVAIFHGIGDQCSNGGMVRFNQFFAKNLGNVYVKCIESAGGASDFFTSFKSQAELACDQIRNDENFQSDFSVVGISQGSLLARFIIESCQMKGTVRRYVSIGGPQMGVAKFPHCDQGIICKVLNYGVDTAVYSSLVQRLIGPAGYFKDISNYSTYVKYSTFLAELNNEREDKDDQKKQRFLKLENIVLIKFSEDTMILPKETAWFQFYDTDYKVQALTESQFYKEDFIGVRVLNEQNKINFVELEGDHLQFSYSDLVEYAIPALS